MEKTKESSQCLYLYHTGSVEIRDPKIDRGRKNADFGPGFYLTPDRDFTLRWAGPDAVVNKYELELSGLEVHRFSREEAWFDYLFQNRRGRDTLKADVVIGPIANDTIFDTLGVISSGFLSPEDAIKLLRVGPEYTQVAVKTEKAVRQLKWLRPERITKLDAEVRRAEAEAYSAAFAAAMQEILGSE